MTNWYRKAKELILFEYERFSENRDLSNVVDVMADNTVQEKSH